METSVQVPVVLLGLGQVGRALLRQIISECDAVERWIGCRLKVIALVDRQGWLADEAGLSRALLEAALQAKAEGRSLASLPGGRSRAEGEGWKELLRAGAVFVDVTASPGTVALLQEAMAAGCGVVVANKHPVGGKLAEAEGFLSSPRFFYEATVGAGLPVIMTMRYLLSTGDRVTMVEGCLSGTLGYLCTQLERGTSYSAAVVDAKSKGYTEPDPREDLSGRDVARKALIMARTAGWALEMDDLEVEALYPASLAAGEVEEFLSALPELDEEYARRVDEARARGEVLRYVAKVTPEGGRVGLTAVPVDGSLGVLRGPANYIAIHTERYAELPLVISGPGAGPEVTAAAVLGDILQAARVLRAEGCTG